MFIMNCFQEHKNEQEQGYMHVLPSQVDFMHRGGLSS